MSVHAPPTLRADAARNRALVLAAAERLFATRGLDVSMQDVAEAAGVGVGTVFRRFATKDELVAAVIDARLAELISLGEAAITRSAEEPWPAFRDYVVAAIEVHVRDRGLMDAIGSEQAMQPAHDRATAQLVTVLRELVARAVAAGELRPDVTAEDVTVLQCALGRASCMLVSALEPEAWRRSCALLLDGMRAGAARTPLTPAMPAYEDVLRQLR